jgi:hypothetical protein
MSALLTVMRPAAALVGPLGPVGPKTITVDGDPSDWNGTVPASDTAAVSNGEFVWNDTAGDDTGNGSYTYPTSADFGAGLFDIRELRITADAQNLYVLIKVANLSNAWGGSDGFSTVAAVLLIDTTLNGSGQLTARPNVNITAGQGWEYYAKIGQSGWQAENSKIFDTAGHWAPIVNKANTAFNSIEVSIPLAFIGKDGYDIDGATWGFMFFLQSHAGENADGFRTVSAAGAAYEFGGCDSTVYNCPKIEDIAFSADKASQEAELSTFGTDHPATMSSSAQVTFDPSIGFAPDTTPPEISNVTATPTFNQADIGWQTNEIANTTVWYGTSPTPTDQRTRDEFVTGHLITLSGLNPVTTYYYQVESYDIAGNENITAVGNFTTLVLPPANIASWNGNTFVWEDTRGDDTGDGNYVYPNEPSILWQGRGDLWYVNMTDEGNWTHYTVRINAKPETIWHQRMAAFVMFIDQDHVVGSGARDVGVVQDGDVGHGLNLSVAQDFAWEYMVVGTFQNYSEFTPGDNRSELAVRDNVFDSVTGTYRLVSLSTSPSAGTHPTAAKVQSTNGGTQLDFWLNRTIVGQSDNWTYVAAGALYDDAGAGWPSGGIRQIRPSAGTWEGGGSNGPMNPNVYDLAFYPTTASQEQDLSEYVSSGFTGVSKAIQVNLTAKWYSLLSVTNVLAISSTASVGTVKGGETAGIVSFVTNRNAAVAGATVSIAANPASAVTIVGASSTTNAFGAATFTAQGNTVTADTSVALTITATVGGNSITSVVNLLVKAPPAPVITHSYSVFVSSEDGVLPTGSSTTVSVTFQDKGTAISGAQVTLSASPAAAVDITGSPATTNAQGVASFTVQAAYAEADVAVSLTATATNASTPTTATASLTVKAFAHAYTVTTGTDKTIVAANATATVTFTVKDAGAVLSGATVTIAVSPATAFDVVGDAAKSTDANGQAVFTLKAKPLADDTSATVTATIANGTGTPPTVATVTVSLVAQGLPAVTPPPPVTQQGVAVEVFAGVVIVLAAIALVFLYLWMRARSGSRPPEQGSGEA